MRKDILVRFSNLTKPEKMRTVEDLIKELKKFPMNAKCYPYEGESCGVGIVLENECKHGFIHCNAYNNNRDEKETELLK